jgi:hypothetical protein
MLRNNQGLPCQVLKVVATELNQSPKASLQCSSQLTGFVGGLPQLAGQGHLV